MGRRKKDAPVEDIFYADFDGELLELVPEEEEEEDLIKPGWRYASEEYRPAKLSPELRLRLAILGDAILCLQRDPMECNKEARMDREHAQQWFEGEIESAHTCSFVDICDSLGLDPSAARDACYKIAESGTFDIRELVFWLR